MKKFFALIAAALLLVSCGSSSKDDTEGTLETGINNFKGTMVVTFQGEDVSTPDVVISIHKGTSTADILFNKVKFVPQMPVTLDITVPGVTVKRSGSTDVLSGNNILPTVGAIPYEQYNVTDLSGSVKSGYLELQLNFGPYPTRFLGSQIE
ncbi:MAG: hypothetical protein IJ151_01540 [Bacteroidales bacterium]|nr:hypothetical protein [Bacteroidales bacterium]